MAVYRRNRKDGEIRTWAIGFRSSGLTRGSAEATRDESGSLRARPLAGGSETLPSVIPAGGGGGRKTSRGRGRRRLGSGCLSSRVGLGRPSFHELEHRAPLPG